LRLSNAEPASWPKTNEASCGRNAANFEWHLPAGTKRERRKVLFSEKNEDIEQLLQLDISFGMKIAIAASILCGNFHTKPFGHGKAR